MTEILALPAFDDNYIWLLRANGLVAVVDPGDAAPVLPTWRKAATASAPSSPPTTTATMSAASPNCWPRHRSGVRPGHREHRRRDPRAGGGERIEVPGIGVDFEVIAVPGHTRGHLAYYGPSLDDTGALFCGDTLFGAGCGRLFEGTPAQMQASLAKLAVLPAPTLVYCAHEYTQSNLRFRRRRRTRQRRRAKTRRNVPPRAPRTRHRADAHRRRTRNQSLPALGCAGRARSRRQPPRPPPADAWKPSPRSANGRTAFERHSNR
jgi:glyoxylase-like metal-dependent hydrolase (beta-lactamase superfamily II)